MAKMNAKRSLMMCTAAVLFFVFTVSCNTVFAAWRTEAVDAPKFFADTSSRAIALEKGTNNPHAVYGGDHLYHAVHNGSTWTYETVDAANQVGQWASIAIDGSNKVHISYYDAFNKNLKYATNVSGEWVISSVDILGDVGQYSCIAIDSNNKAHISYIDETNNAVKYTTNVSGSWVSITIDNQLHFGGDSSIAIGPNNAVHILYHHISYPYLRYATNVSGSWTTETLDSSYGSNSSIAVDSNNKVHISYYKQGNLAYINNVSGQWVITTIDSNVDYSSLALDSANKIHISYYKTDSEDLKYITNSSGVWVDSVIDSVESVGKCNSIAISTDNIVHFTYLDDTNATVKYASNSMGFWVSSTLDVSDYVGSESSVAVDSNRNIHIAYFDNHHNYLKYATNASGSWVTVILDSAGDTGHQPTITIDKNNKVHILCVDPSQQHLVYATNASGQWTKQMAYDTSKPGYSYYYALSDPDISVDSKNKIHASFYYYYSSPGGCCNNYQAYASNDTGTWGMMQLDHIQVSGKYIGKYSAIAIDSNNYSHISYDDQVNGYLKYTTNSLGSWQTVTVDTSSTVGLYTSIAIDQNDKAHISYYDYGNKDLKYATNSSGSWVTTTLDSGGSVGLYTRIFSDSANAIHIVYYDESNSSYKHATNASGSWTFSFLSNKWPGGAKVTSVAMDSDNNFHISYYDQLNQDLLYATNAPVPPPAISISSPSKLQTNGGPVLYTVTYTGATAITLSTGDITLNKTVSANGIVTVSSGMGTRTVTISGITGNGTIGFSLAAGTASKDGVLALAAGPSLIFTVDNTPPDTTITAKPADPSNSAAPSFSFTATEVDSTFECRLDNGAFAACTSPKTYSNQTEGIHSFDVRATDPAGNVDQSAASYSWSINLTPIDTTITTKPATLSNSASPSFSFTANEANSTFECLLDGGSFAPCTSPKAYSGLTAGSHTFQVRAKDVVGNADLTPASYSWTIDIVPPALTLSALANGSITKNMTLNITGIVSDASGMDTLLINNSVIVINANGSFSHAITMVSGSNQISTVATDTAGNQSSDQRTINLDMAAPQLTLTSPADNSKTGQLLASVSGTVDETSTVVVKSSVNGSQNALMSGNSFSATVTLESGLNTIDITATDLAGNSSSAKRSITYDPLKPTIAITNPANDVTIHDGKITLSGSANGTISGIAALVITADGKEYQPVLTNGSFSQEIIFTAEKLYPIVVTVIDEAGNSETVSRNVIYIKGGIVINGGALYTISPKVTLSLSYYPSAPLMQLFYNNKAWTKAEAFNGSKAITLPGGEGLKIVKVKYLDTNNSTLGEYTAAITMDTKVPSGAMKINSGATFTNSRNLSLEITATDATSGISKMCLSEVATPCSEAGFSNYVKNSVYDIVSPGDGKKTVYVTLRDLAGKTSKPLKASITLDTTAPSGTVVINKGEDTTNSATVSLKIAAGKALAMQVSPDGANWGEWEAFATSKSVTLSPGYGVKTVSVRFKDVAGNISADFSDTINYSVYTPKTCSEKNKLLLGDWYVYQGDAASYFPVHIAFQKAKSNLNEGYFFFYNDDGTTDKYIYVLDEDCVGIMLIKTSGQLYRTYGFNITSNGLELSLWNNSRYYCKGGISSCTPL